MNQVQSRMPLAEEIIWIAHISPSAYTWNCIEYSLLAGYKFSDYEKLYAFIRYNNQQSPLIKREIDVDTWIKESLSGKKMKQAHGEIVYLSDNTWFKHNPIMLIHKIVGIRRDN